MYTVIKRFQEIVNTGTFDFLSDALLHTQKLMGEELQYETIDIINSATAEVLITVKNGTPVYASSEVPFILLQEIPY